MSSGRTTRNRLAGETSPYLLQHASNPVDWYPWCDEALERARAEDRPILLSIGYSACHWCHVMERECFENDSIASLMNELFVNIKVDREERPDLDRIYQLSHQILTGRGGGWPLTVFLTPSGQAPIFAGTYFPPRPGHGLPGFADVLRRVADHYRAHRRDMDGHDSAFRESLARIDSPSSAARPPLTLLRQARDRLMTQYDAEHGGFGAAPKFPQPAGLRFLDRFARMHPEPDGETARHTAGAVRHTLQAMAAGGVHDQLGGGFFRYAVDAAWTIPHFEKMLYDNAQLLPLYADAWRRDGDPRMRQVALATAHWVMTEMQDPQGGYYAALDADSDGGEGHYYTWSEAELDALLGGDQGRLARLVFGLDRGPAFEGRHHLQRRMEPATAAARLGLDPGLADGLLEGAVGRLRAARERRPRPGLDDKVLTAWNGLMIGAMARAGRLLGEPALIDSATAALAFLRARHWRDGRLLAASRHGEARLNGYLDDHVFLADGILELVRCRWDGDAMDFAIALVEITLTRFADRARGGFYFTADDHEPLLHRPRPALDESTPSGNAVAARLLLELGHLLGESRYLEAGQRTLEALASVAAHFPEAASALLEAIELDHVAPQTVVVRADGKRLDAFLAAAGGDVPGRYLYAIPTTSADLPGLLATRRPHAGGVAYVCEGMECRAPLTDPDQLAAALAVPRRLPATAA